MIGDLVEVGVRRSVWLWCLLIAFFSAQTWPFISTFLASIGIIGWHSTSLTKITTLGQTHLQEPFVVRGRAIAVMGGLGLYGATRLLFRTWLPVVACAAFLATQASVPALNALGRTMSAEGVSGIHELMQRTATKIKNTTSLGHPPSQHPLVRYPFFAVCAILHLTGFSTLAVVSTFLNFSTQALPSMRSKARQYHLQLRFLSNGYRAILTSKASHYTHRPLDNPSTTIRLLRLLPRRPFGQIRCELFETPISLAPVYEAVSYTWGPPDFTGLIYIQGKPLPVSRTIEALFHHLCSYTESKVLWIDQICINQADDTEKNSQVPLMREIYSSAANTIVWLDGVEEPWKAGDMLAGICHIFLFGSEESSLATIRQFRDSVYYPQSSGWSQLMNIFAHPYFSRVWVIQEVVLSSSVTVLASGEPISWDALALFASKMVSDPYLEGIRASPGFGFSERSPTGILHVNVITILRNEILHGFDNKLTREPESLLGVFSNLHSTLPVDRIYGILSLFPPERAASRPWLSPDYTKPARQVYTDVVKSLLLELRNNHNEILSFAGAGWRRDIADLPSWVPDWSCLDRVTDTQRQSFTKIQNASHFNASAGTDLAMSFPESAFQRPNDPPILSLQGHIFDLVSHLGPVHSTSKDKDNRGHGDASIVLLKSHLLSLRLAMRHSSDPYRPTNQPLREAFWRTLVGDTAVSRPADDELGRACRLWERFVAEEVAVSQPADDELGRACRLWGRFVAEEVADLLDEPNEEPVVAVSLAMGKLSEAARETLVWSSHRSKCCVGRRFCVTGRGYLAMVPPGTEEGDSLAILYGLNTPFVLRRVPEQGRKRWIMVGEAYVHGVMDGEAMEEKRSPEVFDLI